MSRIDKLRKKMMEKKIDAFISIIPENLRYLSGFTGNEATILINLDDAYLLTDFRYIEQATEQAPDFQIVKIEKEPFAALASVAGNAKRIGFEGEYITYEDHQKLSEAIKQAELISMPGLVSELRSIKDAGEIALIREAAKMADSAFDYILKTIEVGQVESQIALELEFYMRKAGAGGPSFEFIVASGYRSSLPHGAASSKQLQANEFVTMDFGAIYQGYCSDITRTVCLGEPDQKQQDIYKIVLEANRAGIEAVMPGRTGKEVDAVARNIIAAAGYGENFGHGLGHSVGLAIHEGPNLNTREERVLEPGMILTVEPGIYIPGWGGVRIEDMVLVTEHGCEVLTQAPKEFIII